MKAIYVLIVLLFMQGYCSRLYQSFGSNDSLDKTKRDAKTHTSSKAAIVIAEHRELAWFLNALYLQIQLSSGKIDDFDVIAGLWEVDRSAIEKLVSLKIDDLSASLTSFEKIVNGFPDDVDRIANVEKITEKLDSVKKITPEMRNSMRMAIEKGAVPGFFSKKFPKYSFKDNLTSTALQQLATVKSIPVANFDKSDLGDLKRTLLDISTHLETLNGWVKLVNAEQQKTIDNFVQGFKTAIEVKGNAKELGDLATLLTETGNNLVKLQSLKDIKGISNLQVNSKTFNNLLVQFHQYSNRSVAPAFSSNLNLASFKQASKVPQIVNLINDEKALSSLDSYLNDIASMAKSLSPINRNLKNLMNYDLMDPLNVISRSLDGVSRIQQNWDQFNLTSLPSCNESPDAQNELSINELGTVSSDLNKLFEVVPVIVENWKMADKIRVQLFNLAGSLSNVENFETWLNGTEIVNIQKALNDTKNLYESIEQPQKFVDAIGRLTTAKDKIVSIQNKIGEFSILKKECDTLFSFDIKPLNALNDVPKAIQQLKKENTIQKMIPLLSTIPTLSKDLSKLKRSKSSSSTVAVTSTPKKSSNGTVHKKKKRSADETKKFECQDPQDLLDVAISFRGLQKIDLIFQYSNLINTVIEQGTVAEKSIDSIKNPENREELKKTWKNFGVVKTQLKAVQENNQKLLNKITSSGQEKSLENYGLVYNKLGSLNSSERVFLSSLRTSMTLFEKPNQNLSKSLEDLEKPLATDWAMTHASFKRLPKAMQRLKSDFEKFSEVESGVWAFFKDNWELLTIGAVVVIIVIALIVLYFKYIHDPEKNKKPEKETEPFPISEIMYGAGLTHMVYQDSRLEINRRDPETGYTRLFKACVVKDYDEYCRLLDKEKPLVDAVCGPLNRTVLVEAAVQGDLRYLEPLAEHALMDIWDSNSQSYETLAAVPDSRLPKVEDWKKMRGPDPLRVSSALDKPRSFKILVVEYTWSWWRKRKQLPHNIKAATKWGYTEGEDLNQYTHIVLPWSYIRSKKDDISGSMMKMDDDNMLKWELLACDAVLVSPRLLDSLYFYRGIKEEQKGLIDTMHNDFMLSVKYNGKVYEKTIQKVKTGIHQMQPKLLDGVNITLLPTKDKKKMKKHEQWKKIIGMFGGKVVETPTVDPDGTLPPYHAASPKYKLEDGFHQNRCWILKEKDSKVRDEWINDWRHCTLVDFEFLPQCIVEYYLLPVSNDVVPLAYRQNGNGGGGGGATVTPSTIGTPGRR